MQCKDWWRAGCLELCSAMKLSGSLKAKSLIGLWLGELRYDLLSVLYCYVREKRNGNDRLSFGGHGPTTFSSPCWGKRKLGEGTKMKKLLRHVLQLLLGSGEKWSKIQAEPGMHMLMVSPAELQSVHIMHQERMNQRTRQLHENHSEQITGGNDFSLGTLRLKNFNARMRIVSICRFSFSH